MSTIKCDNGHNDLGEIDLRYGDESGVSLVPLVSYAWQEKGDVIEVPSCRSLRLNVLGLVNRLNELFAYTFQGSITSAMVIAVLDAFCKMVTLKLDPAKRRSLSMFFVKVFLLNQLFRLLD